jgi:hypothetical protein
MVMNPTKQALHFFVNDIEAVEEFVANAFYYVPIGGSKFRQFVTDKDAVIRQQDGEASEVDWSDIQNIPSTFPPSAHTHTATEVSETSTREWLGAPAVIEASDERIDTIKFDLFKGYQHGTSVSPTDVVFFNFDFTDVKNNVPFTIFSNAVTEPELDGARFLGGQFIGGGTIISGYHIENNEVVYAFLNPVPEQVTGYDRVSNLGEIEDAIEIELQNNQGQPYSIIKAILIAPVQLSFTNLPDAGQEQSFVLRFTNVEEITWPAGTLFTAGEAPEAEGGIYEIACSIDSAGVLTVYGVLNDIKALS